MSTWVKVFGIDKFQRLWRSVKQYGGIRGAIAQIYYTDDLKEGTLVGIDQHGNRYYENNAFPIPKNRWVDYTRKQSLNYDGSQVPPEWHRWLHHMTDDKPTEEAGKHEQHRWLLEHRENYSGNLEKQYYPYSTTRNKIESWQPPRPS